MNDIYIIVSLVGIFFLYLLICIFLNWIAPGYYHRKLRKLSPLVVTRKNVEKLNKFQDFDYGVTYRYDNCNKTWIPQK